MRCWILQRIEDASGTSTSVPTTPPERKKMPGTAAGMLRTMASHVAAATASSPTKGPDMPAVTGLTIKTVPSKKTPCTDKAL
eukprot:15269292-Alexandrium_andersonii.AAC.1